MARRSTNGSAASATAEQERAASAQKQEQEQKQESATALDLAAVIAAEEIERASRIYVDVPGIPRVPTADGTLATVQREQRADGTLGEYLLAEVRPAKQKGQPDSVQRYSIARLQALKTALAAEGVTLFR